MMEYMVTSVPPSGFTFTSLEARLNDLAADGWKVHGVVLGFLVFEREVDQVIKLARRSDPLHECTSTDPAHVHCFGADGVCTLGGPGKVHCHCEF